MKAKYWIILLGLLFLMPLSYAQLYADVTFDVKETGEVQISGQTNYALFQGTTNNIITNNLTSKQGALWTLNIVTPNFDDYIYEIKLPQFAAVEYIKANTQLRFESSADSVIIKGVGSQKPIDIIVQYTINKNQNQLSALQISAIIVLVILISYFFLTKNKIPKRRAKTKSFNRELYTDRQLMILDYLQKNGNVTQADLEKHLNLPKSSLSRNIRTLVQKGIIFSETKGMSNIIGLK